METYNPFREQIAAFGMQKQDGYSPYAAGRKMYGGGRTMPTVGSVDNQGYVERDRRAAAKRQAILNRMQAGQQGNYMSQDYLGGM